MSVLNDAHIKQRLRSEGGLEIRPLRNMDEQVQGASIELRVAPQYEHHASRVVQNAEEGDAIHLEVGEFYHLRSKEQISLPDDLQAELTGLFSNSSRGLHVISGVFDPGWSNHAVVPVVNQSEREITLQPGEQAFKMVFRELKEPAEEPYSG